MERYYNAAIILFILIVLSSVILIIKPAQTGFVVYSGWQDYRYNNLNKTWDFSDPDEYTFNPSELLVNNSQISLKPIVDIYEWAEENHHDYSITYAYYRPTDKTEKLDKYDGNRFTPSSGKLLNLIFNTSLTNGDEVELSIHSGDSMDLYLCETNTICDSQMYGSVYYDGEEGNYTVSISGLVSPSNSFSLVAPELKIDYITSTVGNLVKAWYNPSDKLSKLDTKDNSELTVEEGELLDLSFNNSVYNNDIVSLYLSDEDVSTLLICDVSTECNSNYSEVSYTGEEGWYNLTLSNMEIPRRSFSLSVKGETKIDFIKATLVNITNYTSTSITYPKSSIIQTKDLENIRNLNSIEFLYVLNNQSVEFQYSSDKGNTWNEIPENLTSLNVSIIRFLANLSSDLLATPVVNSISLGYNKVFPKTYYEINTSDLVNLSYLEPTIINKSNILLNLTTSQDVNNANITIKEFTNSSLSFKKHLRSLIDLTVDNITKEFLNSTRIMVYYTDQELNNLDESTLKLYYYNETSLEWEKLNSSVDTANNYIEMAIQHLSIYGIFGDELPAQSPLPSEGSGSATRESKKSGESKNVEPTLPPLQPVRDEEEPSVTEEINNDSEVEKTIGEEALTGFTVFGIEINEIDKESFIIIAIGFLLAVSYSAYRIIKKRKAKPKLVVYITKDNKVAVRQG